jgi:AcrR family transcriptional regulator
MPPKKNKNLNRKDQGEETRQILIKTGARLFAMHGFHAVSMRELVREAGVNLSTVSYHFGGKFGLYEAIIRFFIDRRHTVSPAKEEVLKRLELADHDQQEMGKVVSWYITMLIHGFLDRKEHIWTSFIISRELAQPTKLFPLLEKEFFTPSFHSLHALVSGVLPEETDYEEQVMTGHAIIAMCVKFLEDHRLIIKRLGWEEYNETGISKIAEVLSKRTRGFLGLPME